MQTVNHSVGCVLLHKLDQYSERKTTHEVVQRLPVWQETCNEHSTILQQPFGSALLRLVFLAEKNDTAIIAAQTITTMHIPCL